MQVLLHGERTKVRKKEKDRKEDKSCSMESIAILCLSEIYMLRYTYLNQVFINNVNIGALLCSGTMHIFSI